VDHHAARDADLPRQIARRRHPRSGAQRAVTDRCAEPILDPSTERQTIPPRRTDSSSPNG
jgi:hypothetical protein